MVLLRKRGDKYKQANNPLVTQLLFLVRNFSLTIKAFKRPSGMRMRMMLGCTVRKS